jgi:hypothetical protein
MFHPAEWDNLPDLLAKPSHLGAGDYLPRSFDGRSQVANKRANLGEGDGLPRSQILTNQLTLEKEMTNLYLGGNGPNFGDDLPRSCGGRSQVLAERPTLGKGMRPL